MILNLVVVLLFLSSSDALQGVQDSLLEKYKTFEKSGSFTCFDGSKTIPFEKVNDDFCDCLDGSDEPGTSACNLVMSKNFPSTWKFKCRKNEFLTEEIPHSKVNDGICDCCDGSDETSTLVKCPNTCKEDAANRARKAVEADKIRIAAQKARSEMKQKALNKRNEMEELLPTLLKKRAALEEEKKEVTAAVTELNAKENEEKQRLNGIYDKWATEYKVTNCLAWRQTGGCSPFGEREPVFDQSCTKVIEESKSGYCECLKEGKAEDNAHDDEQDFDAGDNDDAKSEIIRYNFSCKHKEFHCVYVCSQNGKVGVDPNLVEPSRGSDYSLPEASDAREKLAKIYGDIQTLTRTIEKYEKRLERPFGTEDILRTLEGQSFELVHQEYRYELTIFGDTRQYGKSHSGHGPSMGVFEKFGENTYSSWAKDAHDFSQMIHTKGFACFNGMTRSTEVHVVCGAENKLVQVEEPSMCKYRMLFETPAICEE